MLAVQLTILARMHQVESVPPVPIEADRRRPRTFIIKKVQRTKDPNPSKKECVEKEIAFYYVAPDGWVYMCPPLDRLIDWYFANAREACVCKQHTATYLVCIWMQLMPW